MRAKVKNGADWPDEAGRVRGFSWNRLIWALVYPRRRQRVMPTISGLLLMGLSFGIGTAAYNSANNILFITLSLLLGCLIASGVLSWLNFRGLRWRLRVQSPMRVGLDAPVTLRVGNAKRFLPTYGLRFEFTATAVAGGSPGRAESTFTARGADVRAVWARAGQPGQRETVFLRTRLDPGAETDVEWILRPLLRGRLRVELGSVGSLFPFGFLKKDLVVGEGKTVIVRPAPVEYRRLGRAASRRVSGGERLARAGSGDDLFALRRYQPGDSHRLIHWKATARTRQLLIRQFAAESVEGFSLRLQTDAATWPRAEQFELLLGFASMLAEDFFRAGRLVSVALDSEPPIAVRRGQDLEAWLDAVALVAGPETSRLFNEPVEPVRFAATGGGAGTSRNLVTFSPDGAREVAAWADGEKIAAT